MRIDHPLKRVPRSLFPFGATVTNGVVKHATAAFAERVASQSVGYSIAASSREAVGMKSRAAELMQYRNPVGSGPSGKT